MNKHFNINYVEQESDWKDLTIINLLSEVSDLEDTIDKAKEYIERVMTIIKEQPRTDIDDFWILEKLQIFLDILEESDKDGK